MKILISAVSDSDPIRGFHDGALVHIARKYRPDKIIIVYSDKMLPNKERNNKVLFSISENYRPEIIIHEKIIIGEDVFIFDKMYDEFSKIINECYKKEDEFILNRINVKAVQVASPQKGPNIGDKHDISEDIDDLISLNEDSTDQFVDRTLEDSAEKFSQDLMKKTIRDFITKYDYKASLELANQLPDFSGLKEARKKLQDIVDALDRQDIPQTLKNRKWSDEKKKVLNAYLTIELQKERGNFSEGLIRIKNLTEFILGDYIENRYPGFLDNYSNDSVKYYIGIWDYDKILQEKREWILHNKIKPILRMNKTRNTIAHKLDSLDSEELKQLGPVLKALKGLIKEQYQLTEKDFNFYKDFNKELLELLK